jgi:hypothetical protein
MLEAQSSTGLPTVKAASLRGGIFVSLVILILIFWGGFVSAIQREDRRDSDSQTGGVRTSLCDNPTRILTGGDIRLIIAPGTLTASTPAIPQPRLVSEFNPLIRQ